MEKDRKGWWDVPALDLWKCPECREASPVEEWEECEVGCEECGTHDGRRCPRCDEAFDHVWGVHKLVDAQGGE